MIKFKDSKVKIKYYYDGFTPFEKSRPKVAEATRLWRGRSQTGFTVIEAVVAIMVFSIAAILVAAIFSRAITLERRVVSTQKVQENAMFVLESMAREIRVSSIVNQDSPNCTVDTLTINHPIHGVIIYSLSEGNIQRTTNISGFLNSSDIQFTNLKFCVTGSVAGDDQSPKVTILTSLSNKVGIQPVSVNLQTTVTLRDVIDEFEN